MQVKLEDKVIAEVVDHQEDLNFLLVKPTDVEGDAMLMRLLNKKETVTVFDKQYFVMGIIDNYIYRLQRA